MIAAAAARWRILHMKCGGSRFRSMPLLVESGVFDSEKSVVTRYLVPDLLSCSTTLTSTARRGKNGGRVKGPSIQRFPISSRRLSVTTSWCEKAPL